MSEVHPSVVASLHCSVLLNTLLCCCLYADMVRMQEGLPEE